MAFWTGPATGARQQLRSDVVYNERNLKEGELWEFKNVEVISWFIFTIDFPF